MGRKRRSQQAGVRDSVAEIVLPTAPTQGNDKSDSSAAPTPHSPPTVDEDHADCRNPRTGNSWVSRFKHSRQQSQQQRSHHIGPVHRLRRSISISHQHLRSLDNDALCLSICNELLPQQLIDDVRAQLQGGSKQLVAVECVTKRHLAHLAGPDVAKLFLILAGSVSTCCGVVHVAKGFVHLVAKPLRLRRPVGLLVNNVLMPTSLYGPLLGAYLVVVTARGALRQLSVEAAAAAAAGKSSSKLEGQQEDMDGEQKVGEAEKQRQAQLLTAKKIAEWEETVRLEKEKARKDEEAQKLLAAKRGQQRQLQQQQPKQQGKPWWAFWKRRQQQQPAVAAAAAGGPPSSSSSVSNSSFGQSAKGPPTPGRQDATAGAVCSPRAAAAAFYDNSSSHDFSRNSSNRSHTGQLQRSAIPPLPAGARLLSPTHRAVQHAADEAAVASSEYEDGHEDHQELQQLHEDGALAAARGDPLAAVGTRCWAINLRTGAVDSGEASDCASPCSELDGQVSKLQRRWSSGDPEVLIEEAMRAQMLLAPFRPPVFSRLASGKGGCKITAAAAAAKEDEEKQQLGDGIRVTASLDLGSGLDHTGLQLLQHHQEQAGSPVAAEQQCQSAKKHRSLDWSHKLLTAEP